MKKLKLMALAATLLVTMAQCKKQETPSSNNENEGRTVYITLDVNNNSRNFVHPETGTTFFTNSDEVLVASHGHYVGTLVYQNNKFGGNINNATEGESLHFFFLGNKTPSENLTTSPTTLTVNISDQTNCYPQIAYAPSTDAYTEGVTSYKAHLLNQCALVKFTTNEIPVETAVTVSGLNNTVAVNLADNSFSFSQTNGGNIALHAESTTTRWAILLPQENISTLTASAEDYNGTTFDFPVSSIGNNDYLTTGANFTMTAKPDLSISVSANKKVYFAPANLQYSRNGNMWDNNGTWSFMEHSYSIVEVDDVSAYYGNQNTVSLFSWGANANNDVMPYDTDGDYWTGNTVLTLDENGSDWGVKANEAQLGGYSNWRTLTIDEWTYVFDGSRGDYRYLWVVLDMGQSGQEFGVILFPDKYDGSNDNYSFNGTTYTVINLQDLAALEEAGAVFLPGAGYREGTDVKPYYQEWSGKYWSSSPHGAAEGIAKNLYFKAGSSIVPAINDDWCSVAHSVRLVRDKN